MWEPKKLSGLLSLARGGWMRVEGYALIILKGVFSSYRKGLVVRWKNIIFSHLVVVCLHQNTFSVLEISSSHSKKKWVLWAYVTTKIYPVESWWKFVSNLKKFLQSITNILSRYRQATWKHNIPDCGSRWWRVIKKKKNNLKEDSVCWYHTCWL